MDKKTVIQNIDFRSFYGRYLHKMKEIHNGQATALCPFHNDSNPSLSINLKDGRFHCFACGTEGDVFHFHQRLHHTDFPTAVREIGDIEGISPTVITPIVVATYEYKDVDGSLLYIKERIEPAPDGRSKTFCFKHQKDGGYSKGRGSVGAVLYNLPDVIHAKQIFVVEGEGKVELLKAWGLTGTCLDSGANSPWKKEYANILAGKDEIIILPDNDKPGAAYAEKFIQALYGRVGSIKVIELPGLQESEDIIDWEKRQTVDTKTSRCNEQFLQIVALAPVWHPQSEESNTSDASISDVFVSEASTIEVGGDNTLNIFRPEDELLKLQKEWNVDGNNSKMKMSCIFPNEGLIADYIKYAFDITDAPKIFHLGGALTLLATIVSRGRYLPWGHTRIYPNLWTILLASSSTLRKSTSLSIVKHLLREANVGNVYPNEYSPEAFYSILEKNSQGLLTNAEFGGFLANCGKSYMKGTIEFLTELYDCPREHKKELAERKEKGKRTWNIKEPCISWFAASTTDWFISNLRESDLAGGFLARFIMLPAYTKERTLVFPSPENIPLKEDIIGKLKTITDNVNAKYNIPMTLTEKAQDLYEKWFRANEKDIEGHPNKALVSGFYTRLAVSVLKIAMLHNVSQTLGKDNRVSVEDIEFACRYADFVKLNFSRMIGSDLVFGKDMRDRKKVLDLIKGRDGITKGDILKYGNMMAKTLDEVLRTLEEEGSIRKKETLGNRRGFRYYAVNDSVTTLTMEMHYPTEMERHILPSATETPCETPSSSATQSVIPEATDEPAFDVEDIERSSHSERVKERIYRKHCVHREHAEETPFRYNEAILDIDDEETRRFKERIRRRRLEAEKMNIQ